MSIIKKSIKKTLTPLSDTWDAAKKGLRQQDDLARSMPGMIDDSQHSDLGTAGVIKQVQQIGKGVRTGWGQVIPRPVVPPLPNPVAAPDEQALALADQKRLQRKSTGGRASTVLSGGSALG